MIWLAVGCCGVVILAGALLLMFVKPWRDETKNEAGESPKDW